MPSLERIHGLTADPGAPRELVQGPALEQATFTKGAGDPLGHPHRLGSLARACQVDLTGPCRKRRRALTSGASTPVSSAAMLTERDVIMRLVRQLAELLAAAIRLRREGRREEALRQIDAITGRLTGMDAGALCIFGEAPLSGLPRELKLPLACVLRVRARMLRDARNPVGALQALRAARLLVRGSRRLH